MQTSVSVVIPIKRIGWLACGLGGVLLLSGLLLGCDTTGSSLYDPDRTSSADPTINAVSPSGTALAGIDVVTITGTNFSANPEENFVYFGSARAELISATTTELVVRAPNTPTPAGETAGVRVVVLGAENFSNTITYQLESAIASFAALQGFEEIFGLTSFRDTLYASLFSSGVSAGIIQIAPDETRAPYITTSFNWSGLHFSSDGALFGVRNVRAIFRFPPGGGNQQTWAVIPNSSVRLVAIEVDEAENLWVGGNNEALYKVAADQSISEYSFVANVSAIRYFGDALYVAALETGSSGYQIFKFDIDGNGDLTLPPTVFFDFASEYDATASITSLAFAADGSLFVASTAESDPLLRVQPNGAWEVFYPGVISGPAAKLAWGADPFLFMVQASAEDQDLIRINTRLSGAP